MPPTAPPKRGGSSGIHGQRKRTIDRLGQGDRSLLPVSVQDRIGPQSNRIVISLAAGGPHTPTVNRRRPGQVGSDAGERRGLPTAPPKVVVPPVFTVSANGPLTVWAKVICRCRCR